MIEFVVFLIVAVIAAVIGVVSHVKKDKSKKTNAPPDRMPTQAERMIDEAQFVFEPVAERQPRPTVPPRMPARSVPRKPAPSAGHHAEHCAVPHSGGDRYRVERVSVGGSIGGRSSEGCGEHYGVRFVKLDAMTRGRQDLCLQRGHEARDRARSSARRSRIQAAVRRQTKIKNTPGEIRGIFLSFWCRCALFEV